MLSSDKFLLAEPDGLPTRLGNDYARYKLLALTTYISITNTAIRKQPWRDRYFIDLFSGPGKNQIGNSIVLGSPLIALTTEHPFTQYRFNEYDPALKVALETRVGASSLNKNVLIHQHDANEVVTTICDEISARDSIRDGKWSTLNIAFLDPEGIEELHWVTVERLAGIAKMDLIINFSTLGLLRSIGAGQVTSVNRFFGTENWKTIYDPTANAAFRRRALIDFYLKRLGEFGYHYDVDPDLGGDDIVMKNAKNSQQYSIIFASKNKLGERFWKETAKRTRPPRLQGL